MPLTVVLFKDQLHNYIMDRKINECSQDTQPQPVPWCGLERELRHRKG